MLCGSEAVDLIPLKLDEEMDVTDMVPAPAFQALANLDLTTMFYCYISNTIFQNPYQLQNGQIKNSTRPRCAQA